MLGIDLGVGTQHRVGAKHQVNPGGGPLHRAALTIHDLVAVAASRLPAIGHVGQVDEEVVAEHSDPVGKDAVSRAAMVGAKHPHTADQHCHLAGGESQQLGTVEQHLFRLHLVVPLLPVAKTVVHRLQEGKRLGIGLLGAGIAPARRKGNDDVNAGQLGRLLYRCAPPQHNQVGDADRLAQGSLQGSQGIEHLLEASGLVAFPRLHRRKADTGTVGATAIIGAAEGAGTVPGGGDQIAWRHAAGQQLALELAHLLLGELVIHRRHRILPYHDFARHLRPEVAAARPHVAVGQLEPGAGKGIREEVLIRCEALGDLPVDGVKAQCHVRVRHDGVAAQGGVFHVHRAIFLLDGDGLPLPGTGRALLEPPVMAQ